MRHPHKIMIILAAALLHGGCEAGEKSKADGSTPATPSAAKGEPEATKPKAGSDKHEKVDSESGSESGSETDAEVRAGEIGFQLDGTARSFTFLPADKNLAMSMSTMIAARPDADATEEFSITVMNFDAKSAELPATLELDMKKLMQGDPAKVNAAPKPIVQYTAPDGTLYRAYARVTFVSYEGGIVSGKVEDIELPTIKPRDRAKAPVSVASVSFSVAM